MTLVERIDEWQRWLACYVPSFAGPLWSRLWRPLCDYRESKYPPL